MKWAVVLAVACVSLVAIEAHAAGKGSVSPAMPDKPTKNFCNALSNRNFEMMDVFLAQGADINNENCFHGSQTPLMNTVAIVNRYVDTPALVKYLLQHGADVNYQNKNGNTALMYAVDASVDRLYGDPESLIQNVAMLVEKGAKTNLADNDGDTALFYAVAKGYNEKSWGRFQRMVGYLVKNGADVNHQNKRGLTPLMLAAKGCGVGAVKLLLSLNANVEKQTKTSETALSIAQEQAASTRQGSSCNEVAKILSNP